jgi:hypothetical protein
MTNDIRAELRNECDKLSIALNTYRETAAHERALVEKWSEATEPDASDQARAALARAVDADEKAEDIELLIRNLQNWRAQVDREQPA